MKIPFVQKISKTDSLCVERALPSEGEISVAVGTVVEPFTQLGKSFYSKYYKKLDPSFVLKKNLNTIIEKNVEIASKKESWLKSTALYAPYDGFLRKGFDGSIYFEQEKTPYNLLSGVWGRVEHIIDNRSVLIKTSAIIIHTALSTDKVAEGELVVLPNPSELLEDPYFNDYTKDMEGKILYSGYFIKQENLKKAIKMGASGIIAGGAHKTTFDFAQKAGFPLCLITGYGRIPTPPQIFDLFASVSNRHVFIKGKKSQIIIPCDETYAADKSYSKQDFFIELSHGIIVQVLERPYFGWVGSVENITEDKIAVKLMDENLTIFVKPTNLIALGL